MNSNTPSRWAVGRWAKFSMITRPRLAQTSDLTSSFDDYDQSRRNLMMRLDPLERGRNNLSIKYSWTSNGLCMWKLCPFEIGAVRLIPNWSDQNVSSLAHVVAPWLVDIIPWYVDVAPWHVDVARSNWVIWSCISRKSYWRGCCWSRGCSATGRSSGCILRFDVLINWGLPRDPLPHCHP